MSNANQETESDPVRENQDWDTVSAEQDSTGVTDEQLEELVQSRETEIKVIGCGGAGSNTIDRMLQEGIDGATLYAANTDAQHLLGVEADNKLLLGESKVGGKGAGSIPERGKKAALEDKDTIRGVVSGSDMVFVTAGLGGGTGTGAAPVVASEAKQAGALTIAIVSTPFTSEGDTRLQNAELGLNKLREVADTVIVVPNDRLLDTVGDMPVNQAFKKSDEVLMRSVKGITELITDSGLVNLDFSDVRTVLENGGVAMIGMGSSKSESPAKDSLKSALQSPLLDVDISGATSVLVNVTGGKHMSIEQAEGVVERLHENVDDDARIIWGTSIDETLGNKIKTMLVVTGVTSPQIHGEPKHQQSGIDHIR